MKVHLAYRDRDLDLDATQPSNAAALVDDLGLKIVFRSMAAGDRFLDRVARATLFAGLREPDEIRYRQAILSDCLAHPALVRELYAVAVDALDEPRSFWAYSERYPESLLRRSMGLIGRFVIRLRRLRDLAQEHASTVASEGFRRLFNELIDELGDDYLRSVDDQLRRLAMPNGVVLSATLGSTNFDTGYDLRRRVEPRGWRDWVGLPEADSYTWELPPRDEAGADAIEALRGRGLALAAAALGESTDHVQAYFSQLQAELGFYIGCVNLHEALRAKREPTCLPDPAPAGAAVWAAQALYDPALSLALGPARAVGSDLEADGKPLIVITGANRGGKSTFLRSLGLAQLMMQAGMFVAAEEFRADIRDGLFTHFKREEDVTLRSGKLDEELARMSSIVDELSAAGLVLLNESFASTNEREGSQIGLEITRAVLESGVKVAYVTHMFDLADRLRAEHGGEAVLLRAERLPDGQRTFRVIPGKPLPTSYGQDIFARIFGDESSAQQPQQADAR